MVLDHDKADKQNIVLWGILPLTINAGNLMEILNKKKENLDTEDLVDNIDKVAVEGNISRNQIQSLNVRNGKQHKSGKNTGANTMQTRSHMSKSL